MQPPTVPAVAQAPATAAVPVTWQLCWTSAKVNELPVYSRQSCGTPPSPPTGGQEPTGVIGARLQPPPAPSPPPPLSALTPPLPPLPLEQAMTATDTHTSPKQDSRMSASSDSRSHARGEVVVHV